MDRAVTGAIRLQGRQLELTLETGEGHVVPARIGVTDETAHVLRHLMAAHLDPDTGMRRRCMPRPAIERAVRAIGGAIDRIEVVHGEPPRFALTMVTPDGRVRTIDLDLVEATELMVTRRVAVIAVGWPATDWDEALRGLIS